MYYLSAMFVGFRFISKPISDLWNLIMNKNNYDINSRKYTPDLAKKRMAMLIGIKLYQIRKYHGISGEQLAKEIGLSQQQISRYENGVNYITIDMLCRILSFFDVSIFDFFKLVSEHAKRSDPSLLFFYENAFKYKEIQYELNPYFFSDTGMKFG